jgi:hypothetical protein
VRVLVSEGEVGLCAGCRHAHVVEGAASEFWRCGLHDEEPERFPRYPELPVRACEGHEPGEPGRSARGEGGGSV